MTGPEQLFQQFADAYRRDGSADPREYLSRTSGIDRAELRSLIEAFLERAPRRQWDPAAFSGSMAERALARVSAEAESPVTEGVAGWTEILPALRTKARLKRRTVVERLAAALGFADQEERVAVYYNQMEHGQLAPSGVSTKVLEALAGIVGSSAETLRKAGAAGELGAEAGGEVFARAAPADAMQSPAVRSLSSFDADRSEQPDELDLLFTGGE